LGELKVSAVFHIKEELVRTTFTKGLMLHLYFFLLYLFMLLSSRNGVDVLPRQLTLQEIN
jgi:hypothetical protein